MLANFETPSRAKMLKVWGRRSSFNVQKVMWLIGELGLEHQHIDAGGRFGGLDTSAFLAMNPHGRVPVIQDGDTTVWESHAILRYLASLSGRASGRRTFLVWRSGGSC
jgi:glutathione S-transferase